MMQLQYTKSDVYAYQLLHYFITKYQYQMVRVQNQKQDFWLMNASHSQYPIICISCEQYSETYADELYLRNVHRAILDVIGREGKLLLFNTNPSSTSFHKEYAQQIHVPEGMQIAEAAKLFSGIEQVVHDVDDEQTECAALMRDLEEYQAHQMQRSKRKLNIKVPKITVGIAGLCFIYFLIAQGAMVYFQDMATSIIASGAYYKMSVVAMGEYWRIFTTGFLHFDIFHLFVNLYTLFMIGMVCEKLYKPVHYIAIFTASLGIGNLCAYVADANIVNVGIGPGIFGLTAAFIVALFENHSIRLPIVRSSVFRILFLNVLLIMMPNVSLIADIGAIVAGGFLGVLFTNSKRWKTLQMNTAISLVALLICLGYFSLHVQRIEPIDKEMDMIIIQGFEKAGWIGYADTMKKQFDIVYEREMAK